MLDAADFSVIVCIFAAMDVSLVPNLIAWLIVFLFSTTLHEAAHALAGRLGGDRSADSQVTIDPTPHIKREPFGMIIVPLVSFFLYKGQWMIGWASVPYDPNWANRYPKRAALMAAAGPAANLTLVIVCAIIMIIGIRGGWLFPRADIGFASIVADSSGQSSILTTLLSVGFSLNIVLGLFNLIPIPPLDGFGMLGLVLPPEQYRRLGEIISSPGASVIGLMVAWTVAGKLIGPAWGYMLHALLQVALS